MFKTARDVNRYFPLGIQVSARARRALELTEETLDPPEGRYHFALREISRALRLHTARPEVGAGRLNLLAVLCTAQRLLAARYLERHGSRILVDGLDLSGVRKSPAGWTQALSSFVAGYPPARAVSRPYLEAGDGPGRVFCELLVLATQTGNRAAAPFLSLFETTDLDAACAWRELLAESDAHLAAARDTGPLSGSLLSLLAEPLQAAPDSLEGQVRYVRQHWSNYLPEEFLSGLETAFAVLEEEQRRRGGVHGPAPVPTFPRSGPGAEEPEAFSADAAWMSSTVLIAKSVYVWLDQLSRHYGREVTRLDQIPAEELDLLAGWGVSSLWLIGIWCRSEASRTIKQRMGNPEAVASAYSLDDYVVAGELGGDAALEELEKQCARRGIRLACDVVPNHTGIDSRWTREHPDWYIQLDHPPYPAYRFTGPDLSSDPAIELRIEDGYWNHTDAAVVFERRDKRSGGVRYIYHGNDGTHMPWNDTAQLNFLLPEVREAMIRTIIAVARRFRIIRFDAAMTLAKKHFQRLWYPLPGGGAGVPSRAEHALSRDEFERAFPVEFWREVVDRVAVEVPDTLLLAEAFWLMEGYFVRTLGMHRVYNSAFMNMLKNEENGKYRSVIKNVLEFNPEILKRFVNFMNNPDEATAVEQFGKGDKYFGVAVMLATLPGLPMFGHGQFEGLKEKYGMEYRRAYWDESPDAPFMAHHENQICPLLRNRRLFSEAENFEFYDFISGGHVNEDVFAYSNREGGESTLVVYHNRETETGGWLRDAVPKAVPQSDGRLRPRSVGLAAALGLDPGNAALWRCREHRDGLEYLLPTAGLASDGLHLRLGPYAYRVYHQIRPQTDADGSWQEFCRHLDGQGVPDLDREYHRWRHRDLTQALDRLLDPELSEALLAGLDRKARQALSGRERWLTRLTEFYRLLASAAGVEGTPASLAAAVTRDLESLQRLYAATSRSPRRRRELEALRGLTRAQTTLERFDPLLPVLLVLLRSGELVPRPGAEQRAAAWIASFPLAESLPAADYPAADGLLRLITGHPEAWTDNGAPDPLPLADTPEGRTYLQVHEAGGTVWFSRERFHTLCRGLTLAAAAAACRRTETGRPALAEQLAAIGRRHQELLARAAADGYRFAALLEKPKPQPPSSGQQP